MTPAPTLVLLALFALSASSSAAEPTGPAPVAYLDGRPTAALRLAGVHDQGRLLAHGPGPADCDALGMRESLINAYDGSYYLYYDGAGPRGWIACLAVSKDLKTWERRGPLLDLGAEGETDHGTATSPWIVRADGRWHMYYVGCRGTTPPPDRIPAMPYFTRAATSTGATPAGPWTKQAALVPFTCVPGTYYEDTASPGAIIRQGDEWLMFFSAARRPRAGESGCPKRTLAIARTHDLDGAWTPDPEPILASAEQIENSSLYHDTDRGIWYLFTNHIGQPAVGPNRGGEYTDAVWVYWSKDPTHWNPADKAVVLDGTNCTWSHACIGMPSVTRVGDRLALFYDGPGGDSVSHMQRDVGLAWVDLPLRPAGH